ncbi:hypothetical protein [Solirubrobacter ginsenosidimutans]|uniref:hypothetical protein n=1 Tax=Solirubrobacter ginsenosidimutans TaxID=490573 RepID=UPI0022CE068D|nr:hypothetical protein [Solirubrobacter ginsenosidimutans]
MSLIERRAPTGPTVRTRLPATLTTARAHTTPRGRRSFNVGFTAREAGGSLGSVAFDVVLRMSDDARTVDHHRTHERALAGRAGIRFP